MDNQDIILKLMDDNKSLKKQLEVMSSQIDTKDKIVIEQSKMASMGEMINNIAHQWRQPLAEVTSLLMKLEVKIRIKHSISNVELLDTIDSSNHILKFMSHTVDDFRNFFTINKEKKTFLIVEQISTALNIMKSSLQKHHIKVNLIIKNNISLYGFPNEYIQVLINIISNAKDIIITNKIENKKIIIKVYIKNGKSVVEIEDNGGGINITPLNKIFEPFYTNKEKDGTGIGLFMSKLIVEDNMHGKLTVVNKNDGACFYIVV